MDEVSMIGLDLAKGVFQVHGVDATGEAVVRRQLRRGQMHSFFAKLPPCLVGMEACASLHYWARALGALGHEVRLLPPAYVKRGRKNDATDAAAICEAMTSKGMTFVPVKTPEQQAGLMLHRARRLLVTQRTMLANAVRSHLAEFGIVEAPGEAGLGRLIPLAVDSADPSLPVAAREALAMLAAQLKDAEPPPCCDERPPVMGRGPKAGPSGIRRAGQQDGAHRLGHSRPWRRLSQTVGGSRLIPNTTGIRLRGQ